MRALLDVNVLIALLDADHTFHERAHAWWTENQEPGWASCPLTENGTLRIMSSTAYSKQGQFSLDMLAGLLRTFAAGTNHEFWPDDVTIRNPFRFTFQHAPGSHQLTDIYLLALAAQRGGRLITFDRGIPLQAVPGAKATHLCVV